MGLSRAAHVVARLDPDHRARPRGGPAAGQARAAADVDHIGRLPVAVADEQLAERRGRGGAMGVVEVGEPAEPLGVGGRLDRHEPIVGVVG